MWRFHCRVQVKVLWVLNAQQAAWEEQLPAEVSQLLAATRKELKRADMKTAGITAAAVKGECEALLMNALPIIARFQPFPYM
jgi:hypothetical protein